jgi:ADP-ribose pyrophosphatase
MTSLYEKTLATRRAFEGRALTIDILDIELPNGRKSTREVIRHTGAVCILGERPDGRFILIRQFRKAIDQAIIECVAGCMEPGEAPECAALRETREESGYSVEKLTFLGAFYPVPGYCDERHHFYHAKLASTPEALQLDSDENLYPILVTEAEIEAMIDAGEIVDAKTLLLWHTYLRHRSKATL